MFFLKDVSQYSNKYNHVVINSIYMICCIEAVKLIVWVKCFV